MAGSSQAYNLLYNSEVLYFTWVFLFCEFILTLHFISRVNIVYFLHYIYLTALRFTSTYDQLIENLI